MLQLLGKLYLFLFFLVSASAVSKEEGLAQTTRIFPRQTLPTPPRNSSDILPARLSRPPIPPRNLSDIDPGFNPPFLEPASLKDYQMLYTALSTEFAPTRNMAKYVRLSIYDLLSKDKSSCPGVIFRSIPLPADLSLFLAKRKPRRNFLSSDVLALAGKVAVERRFPCLKIKWSFQKKRESFARCKKGIPTKQVGSLREVWPFIGARGISYTEMVTLYKGIKMFDPIGKLRMNKPALQDKPFIKKFGDVYAKVLLIESDSTNRITLPVGPSTCLRLGVK